MDATLQKTRLKIEADKGRTAAGRIPDGYRTKAGRIGLFSGAEKGLRRSLSHGVFSFFTSSTDSCLCGHISPDCNRTPLAGFLQ
jgi:hypothetical protein